MYVVIAGGGLKGIRLAEALLARRHDVLVIDQDPKVCASIRTELGARTFVGSATSTKTLEAVDIERADVAVALLQEDAHNAAFLLLAQNAGVPRRLARMRDKAFEAAYRSAGATGLVSSVTPVVEQMLSGIEYPQIKALLRLEQGRIDVFEVPVPEDAFVAGLTIEAITRLPGFPPDCNFIAVETGDGDLEIARGTTVVPGGSTLLLLALEGSLQSALTLLTERR